MTQSFAGILPESKLLQYSTKNVLHTLMVTLICTLLVWYAQYHWKRRKMYQMAAQRKGPLTLPFVGSALYFLGSTIHALDKFLRLTKDFESPVRLWIGQQLFFVVWKPKDLEIIMNSPHALPKSTLYKFVATEIGEGLVTAPVPKWKRHRAIINPTFNQQILNEFVATFSEQAEVLVEQLKREAGKGNFDIFQYLSRCSLDMLCETTMGITINAQTTESNYFKWINNTTEIVFKRMVDIFYHPDFIFNRTSMAKGLYHDVTEMNKFTAAVVRDKRAAYKEKLKENRECPNAPIEEEPCKRKPLLQRLIELSEEGSHLTDQEVVDEVKTFIVAGSETTSTTESFIFTTLGMFPDIQHKVYQEIIDVLGPDRPMESADLAKLRYLERVIKEAMRLFPVGAIIGRDVTKDITLENSTIPADSSLIIMLIAAQRDPQVWPNPLQFDPDRFLPEEVAKRHPYSYLPFSGGPRNCIGGKYAMMTMKFLIATVIRKYRFFADYKNVEDIKLKTTLFLKPVDNLKVSVELRE